MTGTEKAGETGTVMRNPQKCFILNFQNISDCYEVTFVK